MGKQRWTAESILERIRAWTADHDGRPPLQTDWKPRGHPDWSSEQWPSWMAVRRYLGTWPTAIERAGVGASPDAHHDWTREEIVQKLRLWAAAHDGKGPLRKDWRRGRGNPDAHTVNGHLFLPIRGHRFSPLVAMVSPHWWPSNLPTIRAVRV
jgi:hypothetical protein